MYKKLVLIVLSFSSLYAMRTTIDKAQTYLSLLPIELEDEILKFTIQENIASTTNALSESLEGPSITVTPWIHWLNLKYALEQGTLGSIGTIETLITSIAHTIKSHPLRVALLLEADYAFAWLKEKLRTNQDFVLAAHRYIDSLIFPSKPTPDTLPVTVDLPEDIQPLDEAKTAVNHIKTLICLGITLNSSQQSRFLSFEQRVQKRQLLEFYSYRLSPSSAYECPAGFEEA